MQVYFHTFGCKVNQYETELLRQSFEANGFKTAEKASSAQIYVINSCTVTAESDKKVRQLLHRLRRENPASIIALCGCLPKAPGFLPQSVPEADVILGIENKQSLPRLVERYIETGLKIVEISSQDKIYPVESLFGSPKKTRAIIKIQDGCDRFCSYCVIPYARGRSRSKPIEDIACEAKKLVSSGHKELVVVGINLSDYGKDTEYNLADAVEAVCNSGALRVRLGSLEPEELSEDIIKRLGDLENLCPHFHLALQSGCDKTLKEMNRKYTAFEYETLCNKLRKAFPDCAITTDIMVGFPGESDEDFLKSLSFAEKMKFSKVHIFPYSMREGTAAAKRTDQIDGKTKEKRAKAMEAVCAKSSEEFLKAQVGKVYPVLFEKEKTLDFYEGHTPNYINVKIPRKNLKKPQNSLRKQILYVKIEKAEKGCCIGSFADDLTMQNLYEKKYKEL